jgi:hypothetical protein
MRQHAQREDRSARTLGGPQPDLRRPSAASAGSG